MRILYPAVCICNTIRYMGCGKPKSFRFDAELEQRVRAYLELNNINLNALINLAVDKFISEQQTIEMKPVPSKQKKE